MKGIRSISSMAMILMLVSHLSGWASGSGRKSGAEQVFEQRILPIFRSPNPSSCVQCHLQGVDLKDYILPSARKTFANLRDLGLIDLARPEESRILEFIAMEPEETLSLSTRIHPKLRAAEHEAFRTWILAAAADESFRKAPSLSASEAAKPAFPEEVIRHSRLENLVDSYTRNIWALRFRCASCHMPGGEKYAKHAAKHGDEVMGWLRAEGPVESMRYLMNSDLIDLERPEQSELLLKPLDVSDHGGGEKMRVNDTDYVAYLNWIRDYAKVKSGAYRTAAELPKDAKRRGTEIWLRVTGLPESRVGDSGLLGVHSWNAQDREWRAEPVAVASGSVVRNPRFGVFLQGFLMLDQSEGERLPPGDYQIRLYLDDGERRTSGWQASLEQARLLGAAEIRTGWQPGFRNATVLGRGAFRAR